MKRPYAMGAFATSHGGRDSWRTWPIWHSDVRPFRLTAPGQDPDVLDADPRHAEALGADLADRRVSASDFDLRHRRRVVAIWVAEFPDQADIIKAQLGLGPWADGNLAPAAWSYLRRGRKHRFTNPWTEEQHEAAAERTGPQRPPDAPPCARALDRAAETAAAAAASVTGSAVPAQPPGQTAPPAAGGGTPPSWPLPACGHDHGSGRAGFAACVKCRATS